MARRNGPFRVSRAVALVLSVFGAGLAAGFSQAQAQQNLPSLAPPDGVRRADSSGTSAKQRLQSLTAELRASAAGAAAPAASTGQLPGAAAATAGLSAQELKDSLTVVRFNESQRAYYQFRAQGFDYSSRAFEWQMLSTRIIFGFVMGLVAAGLWFSWKQFQSDPRLHGRQRKATPPAPRVAGEASPKDAAAAEAPQDSDASHVKIGPQGLEVTSSVLGVVILVISLAFFYLYLIYVYPLSVVK